MLYFYYYLNKGTTWAAFAIFLVLDCGVSIVGLVLILLRPLEVLFPLHVQQSDLVPMPVNRQPEQEPEEADGESALLLSDIHPASGENTGINLPDQRDPAILVHALIFLISFLSSVVSDLVATFSEVSGVSALEVLRFTVMDVVENFFYVVGYLMLSVAYRLIAIALWEMRSSIEEADPLQEQSSQEFLRTIQWHSIRYEQIFATTETLNAKTTLLALIMVALTTLEMASSLHEFFSESEFEWNLETFAILRLLLVLAALILQLALSAADVCYASERISEELARCETKIRAQAACSYQEEGGGVGSNNAAAALCKSFGDRVRNHPARVRFSWFHLTTEWALGLSLVVFSLLLAIIGIQLPGGGD